MVGQLIRRLNDALGISSIVVTHDMRSARRVGQRVTQAWLVGTDKLQYFTGDIIESPDTERGCRTKIVTKVADARKFAEGFTGGLHRVLFYGDHSQAIERMGRLMGFKTQREC